jgi:DNA-binding CsgD family transcriptional regulator
MWPLVGREAELAAVDRLLSDPSAGGVVIAGAAGVGKTRLAVEAARLAERRGRAVEWARATESAASMPLGAFAALLAPAGGEPAAGAELLARARDALVRRAGDRRLALCVDDGHLLDHGSAALLHQLVAAREAFAIVTLRRDGPAPDAVRALWKDENCARIELDALARPEVVRLLEDALGGPVDGRTSAALWALTRGNALFVRELVLLGVERGALAEGGGVWRWRGPMEAGTRLAELVGARLAGLTPVQRRVLEVLAVGAPVELGILTADEVEAVDGLEARALAQRRADGRRRFVDLAHPLHGEVVRAGLTATRVEANQRRLADAVDGRGARRADDVLRVAVWRLGGGGGADAARWRRAAERALTALDFGLAERLARAAVQAGGGFGARLLLGRALAGAGRVAEAERVLGLLEARGGDDGERAAVAVALARNLFWGRARPREADAALRRAESAVADPGVRDELAALRVRLAAADGRPREALAEARPLLDGAHVGEQAQVQAAAAAVEALLSSGRTDEAIALTERWRPVAGRHRDELPLAEPLLLSERAFALRLAGRLEEATQLAEQTYARALAGRSAQIAAVEACALGFIWLARGAVRTAERFCREGAAMLRDVDTLGMLAWALSGVGQAAAQAGDPLGAATAVDELEGAVLGHANFEVELALARAWSAAAAGELTRASALARAAGERAQARGQDALALRAWHELCRLGEAAPAAPVLARLAGRVDGPFAPVAAAHAAALVSRDGRALLGVAERLGALGALLAAGEAARAAADAHRQAGRHASARAAAARAAAWLARCEGARPPALAGDAVAGELTPREREVALLAASGLSSPEIAERLAVSVRTVDNHLQRTYRKLAIARREDLSGALMAPVE